MATVNDTPANLRELYRGNLVPLHACLIGLTWILHDYFITLDDEIRFIWPSQRNTAKWLFFWIRYYGLALLIFDVAQIHIFAQRGVATDAACVALDPITRVAGAILLWSIEIILQIRIYALYRCSRKIAIINGSFFLSTVFAFIVVLCYNASQRHKLINDTVKLRVLPGCPALHTSLEWIQWIPATVFEAFLFGFALYKSLRSRAGQTLKGARVQMSLYQLLLRDNLLYFFTIGILLIFNNLMVVGVTRIPWFSFSPFHAAMSILTTRMLLNTHEAVTEDPSAEINTSQIVRLGAGFASDDSATEDDIPFSSRLPYSRTTEV